jgi:hypothetical protein
LQIQHIAIDLHLGKTAAGLTLINTTAEPEPYLYNIDYQYINSILSHWVFYVKRGSCIALLAWLTHKSQRTTITSPAPISNSSIGLS